MTTMTAGVAAAASYPAPFVENGSANAAVVYGANAASSDSVAAGNIQADLAEDVTVTDAETIITSEDSYKFEKSSTKWQMGNKLLEVVSTTLDDSELDFLAEGVYEDNDYDEFDYKQDISMANLTLSMFDNDDYKTDSPTVGIEISDGDEILNYTLDFSDEPLWNDLEETHIPIMGKEYYVLSADNSSDKITLLDTSAETTLTEGESVTLNGHEVSLSIVASGKAKIIVDGETSDALAEGETQKLKSGLYLGIQEILDQDYSTGQKQVEFSLGSGKLILENENEVEMNEEDIDNLYVDVTDSTDTDKLSEIVLRWKADDDLFVTEDSSITIPGFETVSLSMTGMSYPAEEEIVIEADGDDSFKLSNFPLQDTTEDIHFLYSNGTNFTMVGKDDNNQLVTGVSSVTFDEDTDDYFVLSYQSGSTAESYLVRATDFDDSNYPDNEVDFEHMDGGTWSTVESNVNASETVSLGSAEFTVDNVANESAGYVELSTANSNTNFYKLYSAEGMEVTLPWVNTTDITWTADNTSTCDDVYGTLAAGQLGYNTTLTRNDTALPCTYLPGSYALNFTEEDKDDNIANGQNVTVTIGHDSDDEVHVSDVTNTDANTDISAAEIGETDVYRDFVSSALATEILDDQSGDHEKVTLVYHGGESYGDIYINQGEVTTSTPAETGVMMVTDAEVSSAAGKSLVVVGGSCINSVAAELVGGALCGDAWEAATGVGAGEWMVKSYDYNGNTAILVAGYNAADTTAAAEYVTGEDFDTADVDYKGPQTTVGA